MAIQKEYLVVGRTNGTTRTGSAFCTLKLKTLDEELTVAVWDVPPTAEPSVGQLVTFATIQDNDGKKSARRADMMPGMVVPEGLRSTTCCLGPSSATCGTRRLRCCWATAPTNA